MAEASGVSQEVSQEVSQDVSQDVSQEVSLEERYVASMVLSGVGDAMGFKNGNWEFCNSGKTIHKECKALGGVPNLSISKPDWRVSDDTVMHIGTAEALVSTGSDIKDTETMYSNIARAYIKSMDDMGGRSPGATCMCGARDLQPNTTGGWQRKFNKRGGGCGAAMRAMCIGLRFPRPEDENDLIAVSCESGRMTHHHPTAYLGALAAALFTAYSLQGKPLIEWGAGLMEVLPKAQQYIKDQGRNVQENVEAWSYFEEKWTTYLSDRGISDGKSEPTFPEAYGVQERDDFYASVSFSGWGGASGHDAPMIAYDAMLGSKGDWVELCHRGILHSGDNDSTGVMVGAWYGAIYGFAGVPTKNYKKLEYRDRLASAAVGLLQIAQPDCPVEKKPYFERHPIKGQESLGKRLAEKLLPFKTVSE